MSAANASEGDSKPMQMALIGTGTFAKTTYMQQLRKRSDQFHVSHVWSRSQASADRFSSEHRGSIGQAQAVSGEEGFRQLLSDAEVVAMMIVLPATVAQQYIEDALAAGKHVLSEKPMAATLQQARDMLAAYQKLSPKPVWLVGENYRFEQAFQEAHDIKPQLGKLLKVDYVADMGMRSGNAYYTSSWRRDAAKLPGGFMVDSGVHHVAALRKCMAPDVPCIARAVCTSREPSVSAPDTVVGSIEWESGVVSSVSLCMSSTVPKLVLSMTGAQGSMEVSKGGWKGSQSQYHIAAKVPTGNDVEGKSDSEVERVVQEADYDFVGLDQEFNMFHDQVQHCVRSGQDAPAGSPGDVSEAFLDLAVMYCLLQSGEKGGESVTIPQQA